MSLMSEICPNTKRLWVDVESSYDLLSHVSLHKPPVLNTICLGVTWEKEKERVTFCLRFFPQTALVVWVTLNVESAPLVVFYESRRDKAGLRRELYGPGCQMNFIK